MDDGTSLKRGDGFVIEQLDGEFFIYHPSRPVMESANKTAALLFELCDGTRTVADLTELIVGAFPQDAAVPAQVAATLDDMIQGGLLVTA